MTADPDHLAIPAALPRFRRWLAASLMAVSAIVAHPAAGAEILDGIKGADDRLVVPPIEYPWSAIGRVYTGEGGHCSGVLVGPSLVVTAAHCLYDKRKQWFVEAGLVNFGVGYLDKRYYAQTTAKAYWVPPGYQEGAAPTGKTAIHDWAIIELNEPIGDVAGWLGVAPLDKRGFEGAIAGGTHFVQAGISRDSRRDLTAHIGCDMEGYANGLDLIVHVCDAVPGDSGSPIFFFEKGYPMLAAIHVATTRNTLPVRGIAVPTATFYPGIREMGSGRAGLPSEARLMPGETASLLLGILGFKPDGNLSRAIGAFQDQRGVTPNGQLAYELVGQLVEAMGERR